jgi:hypothetical protein
MPKVVNDDMILLPEHMKIIIRRLGYRECARLLGKSDSYMRSLASKGDKRIRSSDLKVLEIVRL